MVFVYFLASNVVGCAGRQPSVESRLSRRGTTPVGWTATFPTPYLPVGMSSAGMYTGGAVAVNLDSISPALMEPSPTGSWAVLPFPSRPLLNQM